MPNKFSMCIGGGQSNRELKDGIKTDFKQDNMKWTDLVHDMDHKWSASVHEIIIFLA
jgi:hypothetical protein